jgi:hypothetical protein
VIANAWIIFPFMVNNGLNRMQRLLAKQNEVLGQITDRQDGTNKALQWMVSNPELAPVKTGHIGGDQRQNPSREAVLGNHR